MRSTVARGVCVSLVLSWAVGGAQAAEVFTKTMLQPQGQYYQATVPDTLDLAERAKLSVHGLTSFLDATTDYAPWGHFAVDSSRPVLLDRAGGWPNWGKIAEATAKMRYICGSTEGIDNQLASLRGMVAKLPASTVPNHGFVPHARALIALTYLYQWSPTPALRDLIVAYANGFKKSVRNVDNCSYCGAEVPPDLGEKGGNVLGWMNPFVDGTSARALAMWGTLDKDPSCIALAHRLAKGLLPAKYWSPEAEPKAVVGGERGHFMGHMHSYVQGMLGMLYATDATHDARLMEFVRSAYEYQRNFGIARVGLFGGGMHHRRHDPVGDQAQRIRRGRLLGGRGLLCPQPLDRAPADGPQSLATSHPDDGRDVCQQLRRHRPRLHRCARSGDRHLHGRRHAPHDDPPALGGLDDLRPRQCHRGHLLGLGGDRALQGWAGPDQPAPQPRIALAGR
ncbi:MAG: hypothetical protein ACLQNE_05385 [Thermoguttaceae bacterium]